MSMNDFRRVIQIEKKSIRSVLLPERLPPVRCLFIQHFADYTFGARIFPDLSRENLRLHPRKSAGGNYKLTSSYYHSALFLSIH